MDYNEIKLKYSDKISNYINRISSSMKVSAYTYGTKRITTNGMVTPGEDTEVIIDNCLKEFTNLLKNDYPNVEDAIILVITDEIFTNDVMPKVKEINNKNMHKEMTKSYISNGFEEIISLIVFMAIAFLILKLFGVIES